MERYAGSLDEAADGARQQERHYQLLSALQSLVKELPRCGPRGGRRRLRWRRGPALPALTTPPPLAHSSFQQRLSYTTLSDLALALLDGTVFEIVQGLLEIQHLTEKSLYNQRLRLQNEHRGTWGGGARGCGAAERRGAGRRGGGAAGRRSRPAPPPGGRSACPGSSRSLEGRAPFPWVLLGRRS